MDLIKKHFKQVRSLGFTIMAALAITTLIQTVALASVQVRQHSMDNTLHENDQLIINKLSYKFSNPKRGDIIIFLEDKEKDSIVDDISIFFEDLKGKFSDKTLNPRLVKRVIGIPGDIIDIKDGYVYVNNNKLDEPYVEGITKTRKVSFPLTVEENKIFVLGDNRLVSKDSRDFGLIDYKQLEGKAILTVYPFENIGFIE